MTHEIFLPVLLGFMTCTNDASPPGRGDEPAASADLSAQADGGTGISTDGGGGAPDLVMGSDGAAAGGGIQSFCEHYKRCGGKFYDDAASCVKAILDYWKVCRLPELNAFGSCMVAKVPCGSWNPDVYNPGFTPCAPEWEKVVNNMCEKPGDG